MEDLVDLPYSSNPRPFDWFLSEPPLATKPTHTLHSNNQEEAANDLLICILLYMAHRRDMYCNYMAGCKALFSIFFTSDSPLRGECPFWDEDVTRAISSRDQPIKDWTPHYEIQRLWLATGIHWSWLEWSWLQCEGMIRDSGNKWLEKRLERVL